MAASTITEASIRQLVDTFYGRIRADAMLGPVFERQLAGKWDAHMPRMVAFWTKVLLGTGDFQSNVYGKHMALSGIQEDHFVRWLALFRATAQEVLGEQGAQEALVVADRIATSLQLGLFGQRQDHCASLRGSNFP